MSEMQSNLQSVLWWEPPLLFTHHLCKLHSPRYLMHTLTFSVQRRQIRQAHTRVETWRHRAKTIPLKHEFCSRDLPTCIWTFCVCLGMCVSIWLCICEQEHYILLLISTILTVCLWSEFMYLLQRKCCLMCDDFQCHHTSQRTIRPESTHPVSATICIDAAGAATISLIPKSCLHIAQLNN